MFFCRNFCKKRQIWTSEHHFGEVRSDARPWLMARWKAHVRLSIPVNWSVFAIAVPELWGETCTARLFSQGLPSLHSTFIWSRSSPSTILGVRKPEALDYPVVKTASFCVPSFWHNTRVWQTDRQTDIPPIALYTSCKASFVVCCNKNCKQIEKSKF